MERNFKVVSELTVDDTTPVATEALVLIMAVAVNEYWKIPIEYFLISGMSGSERANIVLQSLLKLRCRSPSCSTNLRRSNCHFNMFCELGANLIPAGMHSTFNHRSYLGCLSYAQTLFEIAWPPMEH